MLLGIPPNNTWLQHLFFCNNVVVRLEIGSIADLFARSGETH